MTQNQQITEQFLNSASFLEITRAYEHGIEQALSLDISEQFKLELWDTGVLYVHPQQGSNKAIVVSSGVHGNETAPIEICDQLVNEIITGQLEPKNPTLFIIGNPVAMNKGERFDVENMNRLFCGKHKNKNHHEAKRAGQLEGYVERFFAACGECERFHYDLHTAIRGSKYEKFAIYPFTDGRPLDKSQLAFFLASQINTILLGHQPSSTFSYFTSHTYQAHGFTVELGQVKPFGHNKMQEFEAITRNLRALISNKTIDTKPFDNSDFNLFQVKHELIKQSEEHFKLNIADDVKNFTDFPVGYQLTEDIEGGYYTSKPEEAIVFPNKNVPIGQRAGLVVEKTQI